MVPNLRKEEGIYSKPEQTRETVAVFVQENDGGVVAEPFLASGFPLVRWDGLFVRAESTELLSQKQKLPRNR